MSIFYQIRLLDNIQSSLGAIQWAIISSSVTMPNPTQTVQLGHRGKQTWLSIASILVSAQIARGSGLATAAADRVRIISSQSLFLTSVMGSLTMCSIQPRADQPMLVDLLQDTVFIVIVRDAIAAQEGRRYDDLGGKYVCLPSL